MGNFFGTLWHTLRARLPPKAALQTAKRRAKVPPKSLVKSQKHTNFLQKLHTKFPKQTFRTKFPQKDPRQVPNTNISTIGLIGLLKKAQFLF